MRAGWIIREQSLTSTFKRLALTALRATPQGRRLIGRIEALKADQARLAAQEGDVASRLAQCQELLNRCGEIPWIPNGHFYSPIQSRAELEKDFARIYPPLPRELPDIDLREREQVALLHEMLPFFAEFSVDPSPTNERRYGSQNDAYNYGDAVFLYGMLRYARPRRLIEIGSGHSSCMTLDTNDKWFNGSIECTFIEPYPKLLYSLLKPGDRERIRIIPERVQDVDLEVFRSLEANDVLFIDSTHVSKVGSDVNRLFFEVLPLLAEGVYIHIHDVFYPFEYPPEWTLRDGRAWNEQYVLRALLQNSNAYEIVLFNTFLTHFHADFFEQHLPGAIRERGGSIWLRKARRAERSS
jgi:hypothetical protein